MTKRIWAAALSIIVLAVLAGCSIPTSDYRIPDSGPPVPLKTAELRWEYVSAEQNALDQVRQANEVKAGLRKTTYQGCPDYKVCLYQWIDFGGDRWESTLSNLWNAGCITLSNPMAYWDNGTQVNNNSGSIVVNNSPGGWNNYRIYLHNWINCAGEQTSNSLAGSSVVASSFEGGHWWYHKVTSLSLSYTG